MDKHPDERLIFQGARLCFRRFEEVLAALKDAQEQSAWAEVRDELGRLKLWASNIGALPPHVHASLDYRLKDVPEAREMILDHLEVISNRLNEITQRLKDMVVYEDQLPPYQTEERQRVLTQATSAFEAIHDHTSWLYKLSNIIRRACTGSYVRTGLQQSLQDDQARVLSDLFKFWVLRDFPALRLNQTMHTDSVSGAHVETRAGTGASLAPETVPSDNETEPGRGHSSTGFLVDRLVATMIQRRLRIERRRANQGKRRTLFDYHMETSESQLAAPLMTAKGSSEMSIAEESPDDQPGRPASVTYSNLSSTAPDASRFHKSVARSRITKISEIPAGNHELDIIPPPPVITASSDFECPYCGLILPASSAKVLKDWHEHVKHDSEPYICLFDPCDAGNVLYANSKDWKIHMRSQHLLRWRCNARTHDSMYETAAEFQSHLRAEHPGQYTTSQIRLISDTSIFYIEQIFEFCPLCGHASANIEEHVAQHLQRLAFKSLPLLDQPVIVARHHDDRSMSSIRTDSALAPGSRSTIRNFMLNSPAEVQPELNEQAVPGVGVPPVVDYLISVVLETAVFFTDWTPVVAKLRTGDALGDPPGPPSMQEQLSDPILQSFIPNAYELQTTRIALLQGALPGLRLSISEDDEGCTFVPESFIENDLLRDDALIHRLLKYAYTGSIPPRLDFSLIRRYYLKVFSILLSISKLNFIHLFLQESYKDTSLPFSNEHLEALGDYSFWTDFYEEQWRFMPVFSIDRLIYPSKYILPFGRLNVLSIGLRSRLELVDAYQAHNNIDFIRDSRSKNVLVMKTFAFPQFIASSVWQDVESDWLAGQDPEFLLAIREIRAYHLLKNFSDSYEGICPCFGVLRQGDFCSLLLEYAEFGQLDDYMQKAHAPTSPESIIFFWKRVAEIAHGLSLLHRNQKGDLVIEGCHRDIKPANILVFADSEDRPIFKLCDFGLAVLFSHDSYLDPIEGWTGTTTYAAPETSQLPEGARISLFEAQDQDTWSLGCVLSVVATFVVKGYSGVEEFQRIRSSAAANNHGDLQADAFHDGKYILADIKDWHRQLADTVATRVSSMERQDPVTREVLKLLDKSVLVPAKKRLPSGLLWLELSKIFSKSSEALSADSGAASIGPLSSRQPAFTSHERDQGRGGFRRGMRRRTISSSLGAHDQHTRSSDTFIEEAISTYSLLWKDLHEYLRTLFPFVTFYQKIRNDKYVVRLPRQLTETERDSILDLRR